MFCNSTLSLNYKKKNLRPQAVDHGKTLQIICCRQINPIFLFLTYFFSKMNLNLLYLENNYKIIFRSANKATFFCGVIVHFSVTGDVFLLSCMSKKSYGNFS